MFGIFPDKGGNSLQAYLLPTYPDNDLSDRTLSLLYNSCLWDIHHNRFIYYRLFYKNIINKKWFKLVYPHACGLNEHWSGLSLCLVLMKVKMGYPCAWVKFLCQLYRASLLLICGSYRCRINILKRDPFHGKETWDTSTCIKSQSQGQLNNFGGLRQKF